MRSTISIGLALVASVVAGWALMSRERPDRSASRAIGSRDAEPEAVDPVSPSLAPEVANSPSALVETPGADDSSAHPPRRAVATSDVGEDARSAGWDELPRAQRIAALRSDLAGASARVRAGNDAPRNLARAATALSALRPELFDSKSGRAEHRKLEIQFEALEATAAGASGGAP